MVMMLVPSIKFAAKLTVDDGPLNWKFGMLVPFMFTTTPLAKVTCKTVALIVYCEVTDVKGSMFGVTKVTTGGKTTTGFW